jgi:hypothetical protein
MSTPELVDFVGREFKVPRGLRHALFTPGAKPSVEDVAETLYRLRSLYDKTRPTAQDDAEAWARAVAGHYSDEENIGGKPGEIYLQDKPGAGRMLTSQHLTAVLTRWADFKGADVDWEDAQVQIRQQPQESQPQPQPSQQPQQSQPTSSEDPVVDAETGTRQSEVERTDAAPFQSPASSLAASTVPTNQSLLALPLPKGKQHWGEVSSGELTRSIIRQVGANLHIPDEFVDKWIADRAQENSPYLKLYDFNQYEGAGKHKEIEPVDFVGQPDKWDEATNRLKVQVPSSLAARLAQDFGRDGGNVEHLRQAWNDPNRAPGELLYYGGLRPTGQALSSVWANVGEPVMRPFAAVSNVGRGLMSAYADAQTGDMESASARGAYTPSNLVDTFFHTLFFGDVRPGAEKDFENPVGGSIRGAAEGTSYENLAGFVGMGADFVFDPANFIPLHGASEIEKAAQAAEKVTTMDRLLSVAEEAASKLKGKGALTLEFTGKGFRSPLEVVERAAGDVGTATATESAVAANAASSAGKKVKFVRGPILGEGREVELATGRLYENGQPTEWRWATNKGFERSPLQERHAFGDADITLAKPRAANPSLIPETGSRARFKVDGRWVEGEVVPLEPSDADFLTRKGDDIADGWMRVRVDDEQSYLVPHGEKGWKELERRSLPDGAQGTQNAHTEMRNTEPAASANFPASPEPSEPKGITVPVTHKGQEGAVSVDLLTGHLLGDIPTNVYPLGRIAEARAGLANTFISNFNKLRRVSAEGFEAVLRAASPTSQAHSLLRSNVPAIRRAFGKPWPEFSSLLIEGRLRGIRDTYLNLATAAENATEQQLIESFDTSFRQFTVRENPTSNTWEIMQLDRRGSFNPPTGSQLRVVESGLADSATAYRRARELKSQGMMETMESLQRHPGMVPEVVQHVQTLISNRQFGSARDVLAEDFRSAAGKIRPTHSDADFAAKTSTPEFQKALRIYKENIERPLTESHLKNEGVLAANLGPLDAYYPLIAKDPVSGEAMRTRPVRSFYSRQRAEWESPENPLNRRATGLGQDYSTEVEDLKGVVRQALRNNNIASLFDVLKREGLALPFNAAEDTLLPGFVVRETKRSKRIITPEGGFTIAPENVQVPLWLDEELEPLLSVQLAGNRGVRYFMSKLTGAGLVGLLEPAIHSQNVIKNLTTTTPFVYRDLLRKKVFDTPLTQALDKALNVVLNAPVIKPLTTVHTLIGVETGTEHALRQLGRLAEAGALPAKTGAVTVSRNIASQTGAELARGPHTLAQAYLYGPSGIDTRARILMLDILDQVKPNAAPGEVYDFVNQMGHYNRALEGSLSRFFKDVGVGPFYTAGQTRLRNGINAWLLRDNLPKGTKTSQRLAQRLSGGAVGLLSMWALTYRAYTGMWPWEDERARLLEIPLSDEDRESSIAQKLYGDGNNTAYVSFGFSSHVASGARALGLAATYNAHKAGGDWGQALEKGTAQAMSAYMHPPLSAPAFHAGLVALTGSKPMIQGFRDDDGQWIGLQFAPAVGTAQPGTSQIYKNITEGVLDLNGFVSNLVAAAGEGHEGGQQKSKGLDWQARTLKMIFTLMAPELIKGTRNNSLEKRYYIMQRRGARVRENVEEHRENR